MNKLLLTLLALLWVFGTAIPGVSAGMVGQDVEYEVSGKMYQGYMVRNTGLGESQPAVMIIHDWDGLGDYEKQRANMLAGEGYAVFAADLYGQGVRPTALQDKKARSGALYADRQEMRTRLLGGLENLRSMEGIDQDRIVVMGYCFGGSATLELARAGADVQGFVSFHGGLDTPEDQDYSQVRVPLFILHGSQDEVASMSDAVDLAAALDREGVDFSMEIYGGARHAFTVWGGDRYSRQADLDSWAALKDFLDRQLR
ncbi:MAG: dienelactone hydrolase family protein [Desulfovermiculus sp.]|nr:dienelactone hydrolase family protein [Desulfovermiculus sp.]